MLLRLRGRPHPLKSYLMGRCLRIFPLYYVWLAIYFGIQFLMPNPAVALHYPQLPYYLTYTINIWIMIHQVWPPGDGALNHLWSLAIEEQFYLLWPAVVLLLNRRNLGLFLIAGIIAGQCLKVVLALNHFSNLVIYTAVLTRADALLCGGLAGYGLWYWKEVRWLRLISALLFCAASVGVAIVSVRYHGLYLNLNDPVVPLVTCAYSWLFASGIFLLLTRSATPQSPSLARWAITGIATLSYGMYLSHWIIWRFLKSYCPALGSFPALVQFAVALTLSLLVSATLYRLVEMPFLRLKRRLESEKG